MRTSREIYEKYNIMPALQLHQLRVAAVGKLICDNVTKPINERDVILACLFHDMGNIVKFDLTYFPEFSEPKGIQYWKGVQEEYIAKYGSDQHGANEAIAKELGLPEKSITYIKNIRFSEITSALTDTSLERKICQYADLRVGPHGVLSMNERIAEGRARYSKRRGPESTAVLAEEIFNALLCDARELEAQIFANVKIEPTDITDDAIKGDMEDMWDYSVL